MYQWSLAVERQQEQQQRSSSTESLFERASKRKWKGDIAAQRSGSDGQETTVAVQNARKRPKRHSSRSHQILALLHSQSSSLVRSCGENETEERDASVYVFIPRDVLMQIFAMMEPIELLTLVNRVCREWNAIVCNQWAQLLNFHQRRSQWSLRMPCQVSPEEAEWRAKQLEDKILSHVDVSQCRSVDISECPLISYEMLHGVFLRSLQNHPELDELPLERLDISAPKTSLRYDKKYNLYGLDKFITLMEERCLNLKELHCSGNEAFLSYMGMKRRHLFSRLETFITYNTGAGIRDVVLSQCKNLRFASLRGSWFGTFDYTEIACSDTLETLDLSGSGTEHLSNILSRCHKLENLNVSTPADGARDVQLDSRTLQLMKGLREIDMTNNQSIHTDPDPFINTLIHHWAGGSIRILHISGCCRDITRRHVRNLVRKLRHIVEISTDLGTWKRDISPNSNTFRNVTTCLPEDDFSLIG